jgi:hypothetical protein
MHVTWIPNQTKHAPQSNEGLAEALETFKRFVVLGYGEVVLSFQYADGTYIHLARYKEEGVQL